ncbi:sigma 54-interacting transcriptional regulator [Planctomyces sp. SH-PL62]|uniref:sigma 54-interacting transcriptional regulator n=1 Tax=Planctomyces sp. SH-PL62 TaxID=1636152 RepID=UPI00078C9390|nr:sigma 54-interacting transcriptional regulator [Planctomyces sp. SH-PL62]AMV37506.1 Arginine utilization regulatory protein RocR [Planctomyces sp. SH-PL62]
MPPPRSSNLRPEQLWQAAREPLFWLDPDLRVVWVNPAFETLAGIPADAVVGVSCPAHGPSGEGDAADLAAALSPPPEALAGRAASTAAVFVRPDGARSRRVLAFLPFSDAQGGLLGLLGRVLAADESPSPSEPESEGQRLRVLLMDAREAIRKRYGIDSLVGAGPLHRRLLEQLRVAATVRRPVLFVGEPGVGKRHVARAVHQLGGGDAATLRALDCEALPAAILDRELFVPDDPDAPLARPRLAAADGSSLLIGDLPALPRDLQAKLAAALDDDAGRVRILAVATGDPEAAVRAETLREDLFLALSIFVIHLPSLRDRRDEIPLLAQNFLERLNRRGGGQRSGFTRAAEEVLTSYHWPGNLRELARVVEHAHGRGGASLIAADDLPAAIRGHLAEAYPAPKPPPPRPLDEVLVDVERQLIENALARSRRNKSRAAEILGVSRPRLYRRLKELGFPDVDDEG